MSETPAVPAVPADIEAMSYEQARDELLTVVGRLETGGASLEESLPCGSAASTWPRAANRGSRAPASAWTLPAARLPASKAAVSSQGRGQPAAP